MPYKDRSRQAELQRQYRTKYGIGSRRCQSCRGTCSGYARRCGKRWKEQNNTREGRHLRSIKSRLIRQRGHRCEGCQLSEWMGQVIPLDLDHCDGNPENNADSDLRLLCPNCHALTPTYKAKNRMAWEQCRRHRKTVEFRPHSTVAVQGACTAQTVV